MKKIATKKGEPRINLTTTKYILTQRFVYGRKARDIWNDVSHMCSYGYVTAVIRNPYAYVSKEYSDKFIKILSKLKS